MYEFSLPLIEAFTIHVGCYNRGRAEKFDLQLSEFLTAEELYIWKNAKSLDLYDGDELKKFTKNASKLATWMQTSGVVSMDDEEWNSMSKALKLWTYIESFLLKAKIDDKEDYLREIQKFECSVKQFYDHGSDTFLMSAQGIEGGRETVYMHILQFNIAKHAKETFERHGLGIGIFNLQGMERRNKESKYHWWRNWLKYVEVFT